MSKRINNYRGRHRGWKQSRIPSSRPERTGVSPINMMWMNWIAKTRKFMEARDNLRAKLNIKGKKALTGEKRQKVLDAFFAVEY